MRTIVCVCVSIGNKMRVNLYSSRRKQFANRISEYVLLVFFVLNQYYYLIRIGAHILASRVLRFRQR
jgi:hypothetical protein